MMRTVLLLVVVTTAMAVARWLAVSVVGISEIQALWAGVVVAMAFAIEGQL